MKEILKEINDLFLKEIDVLGSSVENKNFLEIIHYSFLKSPGKKLRPLMSALFGSKFFNLDIESLKNFLIGIELIHTYSLAHDDLPALDNDDFRRGIETIHKKFGEYNAILFGDSLHALGFNFFSKKENLKFFSPEKILNVINFFSETIGHDKLIYGQNLDLDFSKFKKNQINFDLIQKIHENKTAVFFAFCSSFSGILSGASKEEIDESYEFGKNFGLAFQILDDIEDFNEDEKDELNLLKFISKNEALNLLEKIIFDLKNFIYNKIPDEKQCFFLELISVLNY